MFVLSHFYSVSCSFLPTIVYFCSHLLTKTLIQMSEFIIHNVLFDVTNRMCDFNGDEEKEKPVYEYPNHYLGKVIGEKGKELTLYRKRRDGYEEQVPNYVLRNEGGIALIRIHNKENYTLYDLPENTGPEVSECVGVNHNSYPFAYVVVDCRDNRCQIAIEKTPNWDSKTDSIKNCLQKFFEQNLFLHNLGIKVTAIKEKTIATKFTEFIDERIIDNGDSIESFTFEYPNLKRQPTSHIPEALTEQMNALSQFLETYDAVSGVTTTKMGQDVDRDKLKQLSTVVTMCSENAFDLSVKFRNFGHYKCNESVVARFEMNEIVISNFKDFAEPDNKDADHDLASWLDDVLEKIKKIERKDGDGDAAMLMWGKRLPTGQREKLRNLFKDHVFYKMCRQTHDVFTQHCPSIILSPEDLFADAARVADRLLRGKGSGEELCSGLWSDAFADYRQKDDTRVDVATTQAEVAMLFYAVMAAMECANTSKTKGTLLRLLHHDVHKLYGKQNGSGSDRCSEIEKELFPRVKALSERMAAWMAEYLDGNDSLTQQIEAATKPARAKAGAARASKKEREPVPYTLSYLCKDEGLRTKRLDMVRRKWEEWGWLEANTDVDDFYRFFSDTPRDCRLSWKAKNAVLSYVLEKMLGMHKCFAHTKGCSPRSVVMNQFKKTYDNHKERMDANDRRNADLTVMLLDYTSPLDLPQLPCNQGDDISDGALQEVLAGNLHTTRDLNRQVM